MNQASEPTQSSSNCPTTTINPSIIINDVTLRDGSHAVKHQLTLDDFRAYAQAIDKVGLDSVEIGAHGNGLGASSVQMGQARCSDQEVLKVAQSALKKTKLSVHVICGFDPQKKYHSSHETGS